MKERVEHALLASFEAMEIDKGPARLAAAMRYAVFPGGGRLRPSLCRAISSALGDPAPELADAAAVAVELVHCASLVHDDLPCFDNALVRRGRPSVHAQAGEPIAVLVGDALIAMAYQSLAAARTERRDWILELVLTLSRGLGQPAGIIAGQAWEAEQVVSLQAYHQAKTASLFEAACAMGALAAGSDPAPFRSVGRSLGLAYQLLDDLVDERPDAETGKLPGMDSRNGRPNALHALGEAACHKLIESHIQDACDAIPQCVAHQLLRDWVAAICLRYATDAREQRRRFNGASRARGSRSSAGASD